MEKYYNAQNCMLFYVDLNICVQMFKLPLFNTKFFLDKPPPAQISNKIEAKKIK